MSSIEAWKIGSNFQQAGQRPACRNCTHVDEQREDRMPPYDTVRFRCKLGGFMTSAGAVCNKHEAKKPAGVRP